MSFSPFDTIVHRWLRVAYTLHTHVFRAVRRPRATVVLIHGIGNTLHAWDKVAAKIPDDVRVIGVDLLGFGSSPAPRWATYSAKTQARAVGLTLFRKGLLRPGGAPLVLVGHSLGALVAVEVARRYKLGVNRLVLVSPPFYRPEEKGGKILKPRDQRLREIYRLAKRHPEVLSGLSPYLVKLGIVNKSLTITEETVETYMNALESSIINQDSLERVQQLRLPVSIIHGALDPVVIGKHVARLAKENENVRSKKVLTSHEIIGPFVGIVAREVTRAINDAAGAPSAASKRR